MKAYLLASFLIVSPMLFAQEKLTPEQVQLEKDKKTYKDLIPKTYTLFEAIHGDLNHDGKADLVLMVKATDAEKWVNDEYRGKLDRNRRGVLVFLNQNGKYEKLLQNLNCFSSENEEGGVYFAPELFIDVEKGRLKVNYGHGRYGYWNYTFRLQDQDLRLIGYDQSENHGPFTDYFTSINFLTQKKLVKENINMNDRDKPERFKETWSKINSAPIYLSQIKDFDELELE